MYASILAFDAIEPALSDPNSDDASDTRSKIEVTAVNPGVEEACKSTVAKTSSVFT